MEGITSAANGLSDLVLSAAEQPWVYLVVLLLCLVDGFFPPVPSESVVVGLASLVISQGVPNPWLLILVAALGAFLGDNIAYLIGRAIGTTRFRWMRRPRMQRSFAWAGRELAKRAASLILVARFIPIGRVAVNLTAGATGYPRKRFVLLTVISGVVWAGYSVGIGAVAGSWFEENHLLGVVVAVGIAIVLGFIVDRLIVIVRGNTPLNEVVEAPGSEAGEAREHGTA
ncbi:alkaline phosphatase [Arthrobacter sp. RIT-PI-e]|uniref:DedA family protein n=1 Tax=Arthrobacter sp. RIT-PI-e TaxID=1681197 RepID=UPI000676A586|nr:DedA family protein [Arthrobacter sp. RIT-PI-e]KNC19667.1 alkaline phosphatase [Arthrobacter sp. RIT-PI-e]